jgi:hypoxanthine phosphoribosyltransferase
VRRRPRFAHESEAELARILDFSGVAWEYEPRTFPIAWGADGNVTECFTPDFYLPEQDAYIELTTLRQSLVRRKNRKLRRLRELYPMLDVKLLYARDFRALLVKYGRAHIADRLMGTDGQPGNGPSIGLPPAIVHGAEPSAPGIQLPPAA